MRGPDHSQTLHLQFQIANVLRSQGRFIEARELDTYVLERQRAVLGEDHLLTLITANGLGADLKSLGEYREALDIDRKTYDSLRTSSGKTTARPGGGPQPGRVAAAGRRLQGRPSAGPGQL